MHGAVWGTAGAAVIAALAAWAYVENYATRDALETRRDLVREIAEMRAETARLEAEWALLNRPARLRALAALAQDELGLVPMSPAAFAPLTDVPPLAPPPEPASSVLAAMAPAGAAQ